jgi:hypothetical protein
VGGSLQSPFPAYYLFFLSPCQLFPLSLMSSNTGLHHPSMGQQICLFNSHGLPSSPILLILFTWPNHCNHYGVIEMTVFQDDAIHSVIPSQIFWKNLLPPSSG